MNPEKTEDALLFAMLLAACTALVPRLPRSVVRPARSRRVSQSKCFMSMTLPKNTIKASKGRSGSQGLELPIRQAQAKVVWEVQNAADTLFDHTGLKT